MSTATVTEVKLPEPLVSVQTRVSWGALLAGAVVAIAVYSLLTMLGIAVGFSVSDRMDAEQLGTGAAIWTFVSLLLAMFFGGWVATRCTAGELRTEALLYGVIVWGITSTLLIPLTAAGVGLGSGTVLADRGFRNINNSMMPPMINGNRLMNERTADRNSVSNSRDRRNNDTDSSDTRSDRSTDHSDSGSANPTAYRDGDTVQTSATNDTDRSASNDRQNNGYAISNTPRNQMSTSTRDHLRSVSWWTFGGTLVSLIACIIGALIGPHVVITHRKYVTNRPIAQLH